MKANGGGQWNTCVPLQLMLQRNTVFCLNTCLTPGVKQVCDRTLMCSTASGRKVLSAAYIGPWQGQWANIIGGGKSFLLGPGT